MQSHLAAALNLLLQRRTAELATTRSALNNTRVGCNRDRCEAAVPIC